LLSSILFISVYFRTNTTSSVIHTLSLHDALPISYGKRLEEKFGLPVHYSDERLTTIESRRVLVEDAGIHDRKKRKQVIDQMAAVLILQNYLDLHRKD